MSVDERFFTALEPQSAVQIAQLVKGEIAKQSLAQAENKLFAGVAALKIAQSMHISFFYAQSYSQVAQNTQAGLVLTTEDLASCLPQSSCLIYVKDPQLAFAKLCALFYQEKHKIQGIHPQALIAKTAQLGDNVCVGAGAYVGENAQIGAGTVIHPQAYVGDGVTIGRDCVIAPQASVRFAHLGNKVRLLAGARIGERGFGYVKDSFGAIEVPQLGRVIIEDNVEVGANSTIDRGTVQDTKIGYGTMIDNMVMIGHNCQIGRFVAIIGKASIGGSAIVEDFAYIGGVSSISGHKTISKGARVNACSFIISDVPEKATMNGFPALEG